MQKYDVEQLLKQQKTNVYQSITTIVVAFVVSICASVIFTQFNESTSSPFIWKIAAFIIFAMIIFPIIILLLNLNENITVKKETMLLLFVFEGTKKSPNLLKFNGYDFSIYSADNWKEFIKIETNCEMIIDSQNQVREIYSKESSFDRAIFDLILYTILRRIPANEHVFFDTQDYLNWIIYQDEAIKNNIFVNLIHSKQIEYELLHRDGKENKGVYMYIPFSLSFPYEIKFKLEKNDRYPIPKIILKNKIIKITIRFSQESCFDKSFVYTYMKPGNRHKTYEEKCFTMTIDFEINKYVYFKARENEVDKVLSWANDLIIDLKTFCDWEYYDKTFQRSKIQELENKLDYMKWEINIENYHSFEDNISGKVKQLLRYTINPHFENRRDAIDQIVGMKDKIPVDLIETVVCRLLVLTAYNEEVTSFKAAEALGNIGNVIPINLHQKVVDTLIEIIDDDKNNTKDRNTVKQRSTKSLVLLYPIVFSQLKSKIHDKIIKTCISNDKSAMYSYECHEHIKSIWGAMPSDDKKHYYEEYYQKILNPSNDSDLISGFIFFEYIGPLINADDTRNLIHTLLQINPANKEVLTNYLNTLATLWVNVLNEFVDEIDSKIFKILDSNSLEFNTIVTRRFLQTTFFIEHLSIEKKNKIFDKLVDFINSKDINLRQIALQSLSLTASIYERKEDEITTILLDNIKSLKLNSFQNFPYTFFQHTRKHAISNNPLKTTLRRSYLLASFLNPIFNHAKNRSIVPL